MGESELLTSAQVQDLLQIGRTKLWSLVREGAFPAYRLGNGRSGPLRYRRSEVLRWLEGNRMPAGGNGAEEVEAEGASREPEEHERVPEPSHEERASGSASER